MTRIERLRSLFDDVGEAQKEVVWPLLDDLVFLEERLSELRRLPMIRVHPKNPARQEVTPAGKQYKEFMQSYVNVVKVLERVLSQEAAGQESPLARMLEEFVADGGDFS